MTEWLSPNTTRVPFTSFPKSLKHKTYAGFRTLYVKLGAICNSTALWLISGGRQWTEMNLNRFSSSYLLDGGLAAPPQAHQQNPRLAVGRSGTVLDVRLLFSITEIFRKRVGHSVTVGQCFPVLNRHLDPNVSRLPPKSSLPCTLNRIVRFTDAVHLVRHQTSLKQN